MTDRVHACLDGDFPRESLTPAELARLRALESSLGDVALALRAAPAPDLTLRVMQGLPAPRSAPAAVPAWRRALAWLWDPREIRFQLRPAYGFAGLAMAALTGLVVLPQVDPASDTGMQQVAVAPVAPAAERMYVQFRLEAPGASEVALAGSFTGWKPEVELRETAPGVWSALVPLRPGVHDYTFVVDGERWVTDPYAPHVDDDFGGTNSRLFLPVPTERST